MPTLSLGPPASGQDLQTVQVNGVEVFYHPGLQTKPGFAAVGVRLRKFLFWRWLELEGARSTTVYEGE